MKTLFLTLTFLLILPLSSHGGAIGTFGRVFKIADKGLSTVTKIKRLAEGKKPKVKKECIADCDKDYPYIPREYDK